jgi:hypothetical protein
MAEKEKKNAFRDKSSNEFGRIVEEIYHPNGNDDYNDAKHDYNDAKDDSDNLANNNCQTQPN